MNTVALAPILCIDDYDWNEASDQFAAQWRVLLSRTELNISLSAEWLTAILSSKDKPVDLRVLVASRDGEVLGLLPYYISTIRMFGFPMTMIEMGGNLMSYHQEIIAIECQLELLRACLEGSRRWDVFCGLQLDPNGQTARAVQTLSSEIGGVLVRYPEESSPYLPINTDWQAFLATKSTKFRHNRKREERILRNAGNLDVKWLETSEQVAELYQSMMEIESHSWKAASNIAISCRPQEQLYYQALLPFLAENKALFAALIYLDSIPIAYNLCFYWNGKVGQLKTSFHEGYKSLSPGAVVIQLALRRAFELGAKEFDFFGDAQYHKMLWTDLVRPSESYYLFAGHVRGRCIGTTKKMLQTARRGQSYRIMHRLLNRLK